MLAHDPDAEVVSIKYFTAPIKAAYAQHGRASEHAQTQYQRALLAKYPDLIHVIKGFHVFQPTALPAYVDTVPASKAHVLPVWMIEEKQTDVNIALHIYRDVAQGKCQQVVICSNDSDLQPALQMVSEDFPTVSIGLIMPLRENANAEGKAPNKRLTQLAHWVRSHIKDVELAKAQLPLNVQTKKKPATKPAHW